MNTYKLTAFHSDGEKLLDEAFQASDDIAAKEIGLKILTEKELVHTTYRCVSPKGKLLLFHS